MAFKTSNPTCACCAGGGGCLACSPCLLPQKILTVHWIEHTPGIDITFPIAYGTSQWLSVCVQRSPLSTWMDFSLDCESGNPGVTVNFYADTDCTILGSSTVFGAANIIDYTCSPLHLHFRSGSGEVDFYIDDPSGTNCPTCTCNPNCAACGGLLSSMGTVTDDNGTHALHQLGTTSVWATDPIEFTPVDPLIPDFINNIACVTDIGGITTCVCDNGDCPAQYQYYFSCSATTISLGVTTHGMYESLDGSDVCCGLYTGGVGPPFGIGVGGDLTHRCYSLAETGAAAFGQTITPADCSAGLTASFSFAPIATICGPVSLFGVFDPPSATATVTIPTAVPLPMMCASFRAVGCNQAIAGSVIEVYDHAGGTQVAHGTTDSFGQVSLVWTGGPGTYYVTASAVAPYFAAQAGNQTLTCNTTTQFTTCCLNITVSGCNGLGLPGATVVATPTGGGTPFTGTTDSAGHVQFIDVPLGTYDVEVSRSRFVTQTFTGVTFDCSHDINLSVGPATGYHCTGGCAIPVPDTLNVTDSVYGAYQIFWDAGSNTWFGETTVAFGGSTPGPGCDACPPSGTTIGCIFTGESILGTTCVLGGCPQPVPFCIATAANPTGPPGPVITLSCPPAFSWSIVVSAWDARSLSNLYNCTPVTITITE